MAISLVTCLAHRPSITTEKAKMKVLGDRCHCLPMLVTWGILMALSTTWDSDVLLWVQYLWPPVDPAGRKCLVHTGLDGG